MSTAGTADDISKSELEKLRSEKEENNEIVKGVETRNRLKTKNILLEPAIVGSMAAINLGQTSLQNLYLRTACTVDLRFPMDICSKGVGPDFRAAEAASQLVVSNVNVSRSFVGCLIATAVLLFAGPWSDCSGRRKPLLVLSLAGMTVMTSGVLVLLAVPGASTATLLYAVQIPLSVGGNFALLLAATFSHLGDVCHATGADATRVMGRHRAAAQAAQVGGALAGPLLYRHCGFFAVFTLMLSMQVFSLVYVVWTVEDVNINKKNKVSVMNWRLPFDAIRCLVHKREGRKRTAIMLMLVVALADRMLLSADVLISYMYYRYKFRWDDVMFGTFVAYRNIISFVGTILILSILKKRLNVSDEIIGVLSCMSLILVTCGIITARSTIVVFLVYMLGFISQGSQVVIRPILNKKIAPNEQGKIYSVMGGIESAVQMMSSPLYSLLYSQAVGEWQWPDAWLLPALLIASLQTAAFVVSYKLIPTEKPKPNVHVANKTNNV